MRGGRAANDGFQVTANYFGQLVRFHSTRGCHGNGGIRVRSRHLGKPRARWNHIRNFQRAAR